MFICLGGYVVHLWERHSKLETVSIFHNVVLLTITAHFHWSVWQRFVGPIFWFVTSTIMTSWKADLPLFVQCDVARLHQGVARQASVDTTSSGELIIAERCDCRWRTSPATPLCQSLYSHSLCHRVAPSTHSTVVWPEQCHRRVMTHCSVQSLSPSVLDIYWLQV